MKVVILCGGLGTRLREETEFRPKPMVEVGGRPILWHIMKIYAHYGFRDFVLCLGYRGNMHQRIFPELRGDEQRLHHLPRRRSRSIHYHGQHDEQDFRVTLADTGLECHDRRPHEQDREIHRRRHFLLTYGDGVSDVDIPSCWSSTRATASWPRSRPCAPVSRFGMLELDGDGKVSEFTEKPKTDGWMSAGYFVLNRKVFDYLGGDECIFEREPLERLAADGQLMAYPPRRLLLRHGYLPRIPASERSLEPRRRAVEGLGVNAGFLAGPAGAGYRRHRPGGQLADAAPDGGRRRRGLPGARLGAAERTGPHRHARAGEGGARRCARPRSAGARLGEYEIDTVFHLAAQTIVGIANRNPDLDLRKQYPGHLGSAGSLPPLARW